jgi:hypothetical protein
MTTIKAHIEKLLASGELSIVNIGDGAAIEMTNHGLSKLIADCADPNTAAKAKRVLTLKLTIMPSSDRTILTYDIDVSLKLAGLATASGSADIEQTGRGVIAKQRGAAQLQLFDNISFKLEEEDNR